MKYLLTVLLLIGFSISAQARGTYLAPADFVNQSFGGDAPTAQLLFLGDEAKAQLKAILAHEPKAKRLRYWQEGRKSVWILEEVGKTKSITAGFVINDNKIEQVKVLIFRESRGWEVRFPFFTNQFVGAGLRSDHKLTQTVDGISGATLSTRAMTKMGRIALYLHGQVMSNCDACE
ncbi:MAG: FMN-binding protein [Gammaproteobacteria bacterium]|nr:MAG: FMN-binding protein [Gammaproteobacteria bacterium]